MMENEQVMFLWDFKIQRDPFLETLPNWLVVNVGILGDHNISVKEVAKFNKYTVLQIEVSIMWGIQTIIGAFASVTSASFW